MSNYEIRAKARQDLGGKIFNNKWMMALVAYLVYSLIVGVCSAVPAVGSIAILLITGPLVIGFSGYFLKLIRYEEAKIENLFDGFKDFVQNFLIYLMVSIFTFLWSLLFIIPGIVKGYAYSMAYYIKIDNPTYDWKKCIDESKERMMGHKWDLFCLNFSFIGWAILCIFTFGIGYLWLAPYMQAATANFYEAHIRFIEEPVTVEFINEETTKG